MRSISFRNDKRKLPGRPSARRRRMQKRVSCDCQNRRVRRFMRRIQEKNSTVNGKVQDQETKDDIYVQNPDHFLMMIMDRQRIENKLRQGDEIGEIETDQSGRILDFSLNRNGKSTIPSIMRHMMDIVSKADNLSMIAKMAFIAAIEQERKGNSTFLDSIANESDKLGIKKVFLYPLVQAIQERDVKRFEMAFSLTE